MKIMLIAPDINQVGGIQQQAKRILWAIKSSGHEPVLVMRRQTFLAKPMLVLEFFIKLFLHRPHFIITSHIHFSPLCLVAKKIIGSKYAIIFHGIEALGLTSLRRKAIMASDRILPVFRWTRSNLKKGFSEEEMEGIDRKTIFFMNPVDEREFIIKDKNPELIKKHGLLNKKVVMTMARISKEEEEQKGNKGYGRVIEALPRIMEKVPDVKYLLVGGGDYLEETRRKVAEKGLENHVVLSGQIKDEERVDYYNLCDVFILPSKGEGCPAIVLLEAMACGKPVITGNRECQKDDLLEGKLGLLIDPDNIDEIATSIVRVLTGNMPELLERDGLRRAAVEKFGLEQYGKRFRKLVDDLFECRAM